MDVWLDILHNLKEVDEEKELSVDVKREAIH